MANSNTAQPNICGILLAAGQSQRFGQNDKLLHRLANGLPLITQTIRTMLCALDKVVVIVPPDAESLIDAIKDQAVYITVNPRADDGMASSLACAIKAAPEADGWIVGLADMPWIQTNTINRIKAAMCNGHSLVAPRYQYLRGHPVGFGREYHDALLNLHGDAGARSVLKQHKANLHYLDVNDPGVLLDVDTPADLKQKIIM